MMGVCVIHTIHYTLHTPFHSFPPSALSIRVSHHIASASFQYFMLLPMQCEFWGKSYEWRGDVYCFCWYWLFSLPNGSFTEVHQRQCQLFYPPFVVVFHYWEITPKKDNIILVQKTKMCQQQEPNQPSKQPMCKVEFRYLILLHYQERIRGLSPSLIITFPPSTPETGNDLLKGLQKKSATIWSYFFWAGYT